MRLIFYIFTLIIFILLNSCQPDNTLKIGFLYTSPLTERYVKESDFFKQHAESLGATVYVEHGNGDKTIQYEKAIELFDKGIEALTIVAVNANTAAAIVREGNKRGIKIIAYNRLITNSDVDLFIAGDNIQLGKDMVNEILKVKSSGKAIILGGDKYDRNAVVMNNSIKKELKPHIESGEIELLYETFIEEWSGSNAAFELDQYLSFSGETPDIIFAGYDGIASASLDVLKKHNITTPVYITGQDALLESVKNIIAGKQYMTVFHPLKTSAHKAVKIIVAMLKDRKALDDYELSYTYNGQKDVPTLQISSIPVTKETIDKVLIEDNGFYTREQVYNKGLLTTSE